MLFNISIQRSGKNRTKLSKFQLGVEILSGELFCPTKILSDKVVYLKQIRQSDFEIIPGGPFQGGASGPPWATDFCWHLRTIQILKTLKLHCMMCVVSLSEFFPSVVPNCYIIVRWLRSIWVTLSILHTYSKGVLSLDSAHFMNVSEWTMSTISKTFLRSLYSFFKKISMESDNTVIHHGIRDEP